MAVSASIHLHLWLDGYSGIATSGPLFLLQAIGGFTLAIAILLLRRTAVSLAGAVYLLGTMTGFLLRERRALRVPGHVVRAARHHGVRGRGSGQHPAPRRSAKIDRRQTRSLAVANSAQAFPARVRRR